MFWRSANRAVSPLHSLSTVVDTDIVNGRSSETLLRPTIALSFESFDFLALFALFALSEFRVFWCTCALLCLLRQQITIDVTVKRKRTRMEAMAESSIISSVIICLLYPSLCSSADASTDSSFLLETSANVLTVRKSRLIRLSPSLLRAEILSWYSVSASKFDIRTSFRLLLTITYLYWGVVSPSDDLEITFQYLIRKVCS